MSATRRRRKAMQRRYAWLCAQYPICGRSLRTPDEVQTGLCLSCLNGPARLSSEEQA